MNNSLNDILNTEIKIKILRLFVQREDGYQATGREIARQTATTAPTAHAALKALYDQHVFLMEPIGRSHVYALNRKNRMVQEILLPAFLKEKDFKADMADFLQRMIRENKIKDRIVSILFYGSRQDGRAQSVSDADVAVVVNTVKDEQKVLEIFLDRISPGFFEYFGTTLDAYVKSKTGFLDIYRKGLPPVTTLSDSYEVLYGEDVLRKERRS